MKFYNTCFVLFIIAVFNILHLVSAGKPLTIYGNKAQMKMEGEFDIYEANANYYIAAYVALPSGNSKNYLMWLTFATGRKIKNGIESQKDTETAVFPFDWQYNEQDKEGKIDYKKAYVKVCKLKKEFKTDEYKGKYHTENAMRTFNDFSSDVLKKYADKVTDQCFDIGFHYQ